MGHHTARIICRLTLLHVRRVAVAQTRRRFVQHLAVDPGGCKRFRPRFGFHRQLGFARRQHVLRTGKALDILLATRLPAALFDTKGVERDLAGFRFEHHGRRQDAILPAAFDDISGMDQHLVLAGVLNGQLTNAAGLVNCDGALVQRFIQRQRHWAIGAFAMHEVDGEVVVGVGSG